MAMIVTPQEITVRLPDVDGARQLIFKGPTTVGEALTMLDPSQAVEAVAARLDGQLVDLIEVITHDTTIEPVVAEEEEEDRLTILRRSCGQLLGHAVKQLYPSAQMMIARVTDDGFDYDIAYEQRFTPDDLAAIEEDRMRVLVATGHEIFKYVLPLDDVIRIFRMSKADYRLKLLEDFPKDTAMNVYIHQDYIDMSRGPLAPNTCFLKVFKLMHVSGAYWRDDAHNEQLQRIHGTAWANQEQLDAHLHRLA